MQRWGLIMPNWILHYEYYDKSGSGVFPALLGDKEKALIERMIEQQILDSCKNFKFVEAEE